jgi:biopolymer transport protein ExbB
MDWVYSALSPAALNLLEKGGVILIFILLLSLLMWTLIVYLYLLHWRERSEHDVYAIQSWLPVIVSLVQILPMVGLLGTIEAMIELFHIIAHHGTGNVRGMAGGISQALITTMAGLVTSLSGYYFSSDLQHRFSLGASAREDV